jgi:predicted ribosome quality control (RQC) complex YloA/Tae2 family protein
LGEERLLACKDCVHQQTIEEIVEEVREALAGRFLGKIVQLSPFSAAMDFGLKGLYLFITVEPRRPRIYLIARRIRELEKPSVPPSQFAQAMRSNLGGGNLISLLKDDSERIIRLCFSVRDEIGDAHSRVLVAQLTGRSANLFLLDARGYITHALRSPIGEGQQLGERYHPPAAQQTTGAETPLLRGNFASLSAAADDYYTRLEAAEAFAARAKIIHDRLRKEIAQRAKLKANLKEDLAAHGDAEQHKRFGDLLLANIRNAEREGNKVRLTDYYSAGEPTIEIEIDENMSLQDAAGRYFARYSKAKRAAEEIVARLAQLDRELAALQQKQAEIEKITASHDDAGLAAVEAEKKRLPSRPGKQEKLEKIPGTRRYRSSDGYEILVGRAAHNNDHLTFRVGRPNDLWLHAADYPGSHVIIRNPDRGEIPHRTIIEAAQLAAKFSQANKDAKVTVHYTLRKFLSKPKGAARGLVRMSSFRTITVEPKEDVERI